MAPITWRNIDAPNLNGGAYGLQLAGQSFDRAADGVNRLFEAQQRVDDSNWDNQSRINTQDAVARLKGLANLQDLNAQEGSFDPTALRSTMGQQFDAASILRALAEQRAKLTGEAVVAAGTTGLNTADSTHSVAQAVDAYRNSLIQSGVKDPNVINSKVQEFMQSGLAAKKEGWKEQGDKFVASSTANLLAPNMPQQGNSTNGNSVLNNTIMPMIFQHEGGYNSNDGNGHPVNMGINGKFHPGVDIKNLTQDQAKEIYKNNYWSAINGDSLPPDVATMAMDIAVNQGPAVAKRIIAQSNGDLNTMLQLRKQAYQEVVLKNPDKAKYMPTWLDRADKTASVAQSLTPTQQVGMQLNQAIQQGIPVTSEMVNTLKTAASGIEKEQRATTLFNQSQDKVALDKDTDATVAKIWEATRANGGDPRQAIIDFTQGKANAGDIATKFNDQYTKLTAPTEQEKTTLDLLEKKLTNAAKVQSAQDTNIVNTEKANFGMVQSLKDDDPLLQAANTHVGGIAGAIQSKTDDTGFISKHLSGLTFNNEVLDKLSELHAELVDGGQGYTPELANRIIIQAIRLSGGPREKAIGSNKGLDLNKLYKNLPEASRMEDAIGVAKGRVAAAENRAATNAAKDDAAVAELTKMLKDDFTKSRITGSKFEGKEANDWAMKRLAEAYKAVEQPPASVQETSAELIKRRQELVKRVGKNTYTPQVSEFGFGFGH